ncbi:MAG: hypothetical protein QOF51_1319, partial [Chloroflexota bacterium]|nr:hypothetical protein [Chloroflexota bacterium]
MRIGINALFLQRPTTGMGQHLFHLLEGLDQNDRENSYVLLTPRFRTSVMGRFPQLSDRFQNVEVTTPVRRLGEKYESLWWEQIGIVRTCRREHVDVLHSPYFAAPIVLPAPTVVTVH